MLRRTTIALVLLTALLAPIVAATARPAAPVSGQSTADAITYFALGDSIASGHGLGDEDGNHDLRASKDDKVCRRSLPKPGDSRKAYPYYVAEHLKNSGYEVDFGPDHHLACSGATASDQSNGDLHRLKSLSAQVDDTLTKIRTIDPSEPILVSITIGANDFGFGDQCNFFFWLFSASQSGFENWATTTATIVRLELRKQIGRLLNASPNVSVVVTEVFNPFNRDSTFFNAAVGLALVQQESCAQFPDHYPSGLYERTQFALGALNSNIHTAVEDDVAQPDRATLTFGLADAFLLHASPKDTQSILSTGQCGGYPSLALSTVDSTWIQYPADRTSNSYSLPDAKPLFNHASGDCIHPNEKGARAIASAVALAAYDVIYEPDPPAPGDFRISAREPWTDTGLWIERGSMVAITAAGTIKVSDADPGKTPDGDAGCVASSEAVAPVLACHALVGRIGGGTPFQVGSSTRVQAQSTGYLSLGPNEQYGWFGDNRGYWTATISTESGEPGHDGCAETGANSVALDVTVTPIGGSLIAIDDCFVIRPNEPLRFSPVANDYRDKEHEYTWPVQEWQEPSHGTLVNVDGVMCGARPYNCSEVLYRPDSKFAGTDTFDYVLTDGRGLTDVGTVTVVVTNAAPVAVADSLVVHADSGASNRTRIVRFLPTFNDSDPDGDRIWVERWQNPAHGAVNRASACNDDSGQLSDIACLGYSPDPGFVGADTFTYVLTDGVATSVGVVTIVVSNVAPVAMTDNLTTNANTYVQFGPTFNDDDADSDSPWVAEWQDPPHGTITGTSSGGYSCRDDAGTLYSGRYGCWRYTPDRDFVGADTFTYVLTDGIATAVGTVTVVVGGSGLSPTPTRTPTRTTTPTATAVATQTATATPTQAIGDPTLTLDKAKSKYNGWVNIDLTGFAPNSTVTLRWPRAYEHTTGYRKGETTDLMAEGTTDAGGTVTLGFRTPLEPLGDYTITARDAAGNRATIPFRVIPRIMLAPESEGPTGFRFRVYFYGFSAGEQVQVHWYTSTTKYTVLNTATIARNGRGSVLLNVPTNATIGDHMIRGKVIGVSRSATTSFLVTGARAAEVPTETGTPVLTETGTPEARAFPTETGTPDPTTPPTETGTPEPPQELPTETPMPTATETVAPTSTEEPPPTETPTPEPL